MWCPSSKGQVDVSPTEIGSAYPESSNLSHLSNFFRFREGVEAPDDRTIGSFGNEKPFLTRKHSSTEERRETMLFSFWPMTLGFLAQRRCVWAATDSEMNNIFGRFYTIIHIFRCDGNIDNINRLLFDLAWRASNSCASPKWGMNISGSIEHTWTWETFFSFFIQCLEVVSMFVQLVSMNLYILWKRAWCENWVDDLMKVTIRYQMMIDNYNSNSVVWIAEKELTHKEIDTSWKNHQ